MTEVFTIILLTHPLLCPHLSSPTHNYSHAFMSLFLQNNEYFFLYYHLLLFDESPFFYFQSVSYGVIFLKWTLKSHTSQSRVLLLLPPVDFWILCMQND